MVAYVPKPVQVKIFAGKAGKDITVPRGHMVTVSEHGKIEILSPEEFQRRFQVSADESENVADIGKKKRITRERQNVANTHVFRAMEKLCQLYLVDNPKAYMIPLHSLQACDKDINMSARLADAVNQEYAIRHKSGNSVSYRPTEKGMEWVKNIREQASIPGIE